MQSQGSFQRDKSVREIWRCWTAGFEAEGNGPEPRNVGGLRLGAGGGGWGQGGNILL